LNRRWLDAITETHVECSKMTELSNIETLERQRE